MLKQNKKQVIKHLLESPFDSAWKLLDEPVEKEVLSLLCAALKPLGQYRKSYNDTRRRRHKLRLTQSTSEQTESNTDLCDANRVIRDALVIGLNSVTAHLSKPVSKDASPRLQIVFVCYYDVKPQIMCAHLPTLAHVHGSTILVSLRQGAEAQLADCTAMRRVSALCIKNTEGERFRELVELVKSALEPVKLTFFDKHPSFLPERISSRDATRKKPSRAKSQDRPKPSA